MKFIHTSDWHLGRMFHNVSLLHDQALVIQQIMDYAQREQIDALVVAGDIYDRSVPPASAVSLLDSVLNKLCGELNIPVIMISGNHDSAERIGFAAQHMQHAGIYIRSRLEDIDQPVTIRDAGGQHVDFYGIPYHSPELVNHVYGAEVKDFNQAHQFLVDKILQQADPAHKNVLISHCFLRNSLESDSERPLSVGGADQVEAEPLKEFDYVALGHLHRPQTCGAEHIRYSGSLLKYSFSEAEHDKTVQLVEFTSNRDLKMTQLPLHAQRDVRILQGTLQEILDKGESDPHKHDFILARLTDKQAILDVMGKLRKCYPNVLQIEKMGWREVQAREVKMRKKATRQYADMFGDFYSQVMGEALTESQRRTLDQVIEQLNSSREDVEGGHHG